MYKFSQNSQVFDNKYLKKNGEHNSQIIRTKTNIIKTLVQVHQRIIKLFLIQTILKTIPCSCGWKHKGETGHPLKVRLQEHQKAVTRGEVEKSGMADHIWREKGDYPLLWDQVEIIDKEHHWKIGKYKESTHMLGHKKAKITTKLQYELW